MKRFITSVICSMILFSCNSANNQHPSARYEEKKASLEEMEKASPLKFLKVTGDFHGNLLNQAVVKGEITNSATLVSYTRIQLLIIFKDKDGVVIEKQKQMLDDVIRPGAVTSFKIKASHISGADAVAVDITDAVAEK